MDKWFEDKFDGNKVRKYTRRRLSPGYLEKVSRKFSITNWLIITNVIIFIIVFILIGIFGEDKIYSWFALQPQAVFSGVFWTLLSSMFVHILIGHLLANMVSLFFIGNFAERLIGRKRFFWLYIISGIFAGFFYAALSILFGNSGIGERIFTNPITYAVGASGAIFSLLGLLAVLTPKNKVYLIAGPIIAIIIQAVLESVYPNAGFMTIISLLITFYVIFSIFSMLSFNRKISRISLPLEMSFWVLPFIAVIPLIIIGLFVPLPIGNTAHLGGLIAGLYYGFYLKIKYKKKTAIINRYFSR